LLPNGDTWSRHHGGTENPRVGGSIPSLATSDSAICTYPFHPVIRCSPVIATVLREYFFTCRRLMDIFLWKATAARVRHRGDKIFMIAKRKTKLPWVIAEIENRQS
jgi:hypothetical protein